MKTKRTRQKLPVAIHGKKVGVNQKRADAITTWIRKNKKIATENIYVQNQLAIEKQGKETYVKVFRLPRKLLRLNPDNHRFATDWENLKADRIAAGKKGDPNLEDEDDVQEIRDVLTGENPPNNDRINTFDALKTALERAANAGIKADHNGQTMAGIITWDGRYINANRRDTAFHEIQKDLIKEGKKKSGIDVSKFDFIFVARCPEDIWDEDILSMEMAAQISKDTRDSYDYMNAALLIRAKFKSIYEPKIAGVTSQTEREKARDEAIQATASKVDLGKKGKGPAKIKEYLTFLQFVDGVLNTMKQRKKYNIVNKSRGSKTPVSNLLVEAAKDWNAMSTPRDRSEFMREIAMEVDIHQNDSTKDSFSVRDNYRQFRKSTKHPVTKQLIKGEAKKYDFNNSTKSAKAALPNVKKAIDRWNAEDESAEPIKLLNKTVENLEAIHRAITTSSGSKEKLKKLSAEYGNVQNVVTVSKRIQDIVKKFSAIKKLSSNQKPKGKMKKKKVKGKKKGKRRLTPGKKSKR